MKTTEPAQLKRIALSLRQDVLNMIYQAQSGHPASSLGLADLFTSLYFAGGLRHDPKRPTWSKRDYLLVSNGHICSIWYASLAKAGYFSREELNTFRQLNSRLQGHPHLLMTPAGPAPTSLPGIENTSGSLGQGSSQAAGLAYALKLDQQNNHVFCLLSDGEQQEGQTWESYLFATHHQLNNLTFIIDDNHIQISGDVPTVMSLGNLKLKLIAFGLNVLEVDAHDFAGLIKVLNQAKQQSQASAIIAHSVPGKGVSFMEHDYHWHGQAPNKQQLEAAQAELRAKKKNLA